MPEADLFAGKVWTPERKKGSCVRDPQAGPGSCWHWWEQCPNPEKKNCYRLWKWIQAGKPPEGFAG